MRNFSYHEHTADLRMTVKADTVENLFSAALEGMSNLLKKEAKPDGKENKAAQSINIKAGDQTTLLIDFLSEVLALSYSDKTVYLPLHIKLISSTEIDAALSGVPVDHFDEDIKAVTYHEADITKNREGNWETTIIFDI